MAKLFINILNMSISACWVILAVLLVRLLLRKGPRWLHVLLWGMVAVRLICPFSVESMFSLIPSAQTISPEIMLDPTPSVDTGIPVLNAFVDPVLGASSTPDVGASVNPLQIIFAVAAFIWCIGMTVMLLHAIISYLLLRRGVRTAVRLDRYIYQCETVQSPFVLGIIRPRIYLPFTIGARNIDHVIAHERAHIRRKDHWWKPVGVILLSVHWFNPFMWLGYYLLCKDIELACDEKVIKALDTEARADYSAAILSCSVNRRIITACPIAFGEVSVKTRVKTVLNYKKPAFWMIVIAIVLSCVVVICFLTNPVGSSGEPDLSFLNYENAGLQVIDVTDVQVIYCPPSQKGEDSVIQVGTTNGNKLAKYLDDRNWKITKEPAISLPSPGSVEFILHDQYRITVYDRKAWSLAGYAKVEFENDVRYYRIGGSDYQDAVALLQSPVKKGYDDKYYLRIGMEDIYELRIKTPFTTQIQRNTWGQPFAVGQQVHLEALDGFEDIRGVTVSAMGKKGQVLYNLTVPQEAANSEIINLIAGDGWVLSPMIAIGSEEDGKYYHIISTEGVAELKFSGTNFSGGSVPAFGDTFPCGEKVLLEPLTDLNDLDDVVVTALDKEGNILYRFLPVPNSTDEQANETLGYDGGLGFSDLGPNEEITSGFEIRLDKPINTLQFSITWARSGLTLEYGIRSSEGVEFYGAKEGGYDNGQLEGIPQGTYQLFVRNTDYSGLAAFENPEAYPDVSFNATGAMNYRVD